MLTGARVEAYSERESFHWNESDSSKSKRAIQLLRMRVQVTWSTVVHSGSTSCTWTSRWLLSECTYWTSAVWSRMCQAAFSGQLQIIPRNVGSVFFFFLKKKILSRWEAFFVASLAASLVVSKCRSLPCLFKRFPRRRCR